MDNPVYRFFVSPFMRSLYKLAAYIVVAYNTLLICVVGGFVAMGLLFMGMAGAPTPATSKLDGLETVAGNELSSNQLLVIPISGAIVGDEDEELASFGGVTNGYEVKERLMEAAGRDDIKGVLLKINSPGGTIYGSHAIADGVKYYRDKAKRPVIAYVQGLGASGAYWAAAAADRIIADYGSDLGSIGVIMGPFKYYNTVLSETGNLFESGVITQRGIESVNITAGKSKDIGDPYRRLTAEEQAQLQRSVNNEYDQFVAFVAERRGLTPDVVKGQIGAMIYDTTTAKNLKLIDTVGNREDAYAALAEAAKIEGDDYRVVRPLTPSSFVASLLGVLGHKPAPKAQFDTCKLTRTPLAYHGSVVDLCPAQ